MPFQPQHSLLRVEVPALHSIDTSSVENLFGMWSLFSKTSHAMEDGKRLENLSWRLWNRETFCCDPQSRPRPSRFAFEKASPATAAPPALSSSIDSASSSESDAVTTDDEEDTPAVTSNARPEIRRHDLPATMSRGREKHLTSDDLANFVASIKRTQSLEPIELPIPGPSSPSLQRGPTGSRHVSPPQSQTHSAHPPVTKPTSEKSDAATSSTTNTTTDAVSISRTNPLESSASTVDTEDGSQTVGSDSSSNTEMSTHSVIRGFVPGGVPSSYRSQTNLAAQPTPILKTSPKFNAERPKKRGGPMFQIGTSSGEDESSFEAHMHKGSLLSESLKREGSDGGRKHTSFRKDIAVARAAEHSPVFETDEEDEEVSESAIEDDDDSSDWEDSEDQSRPSSVNEKEMFQRVDSRPDLTSRRSLLTTLMHEPDRAKALANAASRSTPAMRRSRASTPNGPSVATTPEQSHQFPTSGTEGTRPQPIIMTTSNTHPHQLALSPRTTRRNMLSTELTESLRKNLLWERQHRSSGNLAALKRRHTSNDVKNLRQHPEPGPVLSQQDGTRRFDNEFFNQGLQEYHAKGW